jgi:LysM repeat protein
MIAQAIVESGYGTSTLSQAPYYNLFGIKGSYNGQSVKMSTQEYDAKKKKWKTIKADFRAYPSFAQSFADNAAVLRYTSFGSGAYYAGAWKTYAKNYQAATAWLTGRYATDPGYAGKLNQVIQTYGLTKYDSGRTTVASIPQTAAPQAVTPTPVTTPNKTVTVKSGDSVWLLATKYGISMDQLRSWNNIKKDFIYVGQKLIVKKGTTTTAPVATPTQPKTQPTTTYTTTYSTVSVKKYYKVVANDSVWLISQKTGVTAKQLVQWNKIKKNFVYPGQKLYVGTKTKTVAKQVKKTAPAATATYVAPSTSKLSGTTYKVKSGDSLWLISQRAGLKLETLKKLNHIKNDMIYVGQTLRIR